jgi:DNA-binding NtrC family response regulator
MCTCAAIVVLLVDDHPAFRNGVAANLSDDGHPVHECADPADVTTAQLSATNVVVIDPVRESSEGAVFSEDLHHARPDLAILVLTAYWTVEVEATAVTRPYMHVCRKPIDYDELHAWIHELAVAV